MSRRVGAVRYLSAGDKVADSRYEAEASLHLQERLRILYGVMAGGSVAFYVVNHAFHLAAGDWTAATNLLAPGPLVHLAHLILTVTFFAFLGRHERPMRTLRLLDAAAFYLGVGACLAIYTLEYERGPHDVVGILAIFVITRAVVIPSTAWRTLLLASPVPAALLAVQLGFGTAYTYDEREMDPAFVESMVLWSQVLLLFGIAIATIASRVIYALRDRLRSVRDIGHYRLDEKIGSGAMGEVYRATNVMLRRPTAVKLLRPEITGEQTIRRFEEEVRLASRLSHPNTIRIFDYGRTAEGLFFCAMEYVRGMDLGEIVQRTGRLPAGRVAHVLEQACRALGEAHALGLVHRDVKPGNLMLCEKGGEHDVLKVLDFGLAKDLGSDDAPAGLFPKVCGTLETISPEVLKGEACTPACDLYALGVVGCYLLTAAYVFDVPSPIDLIQAQLNLEPIAPSARGVKVPADLEAVLLRCLQKDPARRPESAAALGAAIRASSAYGTWTEAEAAAWWREALPRRAGDAWLGTSPTPVAPRLPP